MSGSGSPHAWWPRNRGWLAGALVLGALAVFLPYRAEQRERDRAESRHAVQARDGHGAYEGARWRLVRVERRPAPAEMGGYPHGPAQLLVVHYEVVPGPGAHAQALDACIGRLVARDGRRWEANAPSPVASWLSRQRLNRTCGSRAGAGLARIPARAGVPMPFVHAYLLPADLALAGLQAQVALPPSTTTPPGHVLSFALPPVPR